MAPHSFMFNKATADGVEPTEHSVSAVAELSLGPAHRQGCEPDPEGERHQWGHVGAAVLLSQSPAAAESSFPVQIHSISCSVICCCVTHMCVTVFFGGNRQLHDEIQLPCQVLFGKNCWGAHCKAILHSTAARSPNAGMVGNSAPGAAVGAGPLVCILTHKDGELRSSLTLPYLGCRGGEGGVHSEVYLYVRKYICHRHFSQRETFSLLCIWYVHGNACERRNGRDLSFDAFNKENCCM